MKISVIVEGSTEKVFGDAPRRFLVDRLAGRMPKLVFIPQRGRIPTGDKLRGLVVRLLTTGPSPADAVIALTDVHTGDRRYEDAADAKAKLGAWVPGESRFHPHAAQYELDAWLLPYWSKIQRMAGHNRNPPDPDPERVDHEKPPSKHLAELFQAGTRSRQYAKTRDAAAILRGEDLMVSARACAELRGMLNTILSLSGGEPIAEPGC